MKLTTIKEAIRETKPNPKKPANYHNTQAEAIDAAEDMAKAYGYEVVFPDNIWTEKVDYGKTVKYSLALKKDGKEQRKMLNISLYRMESGKYELTTYIN